MLTVIRIAVLRSVKEKAAMKAWLAPLLFSRPMRMATTVAPIGNMDVTERCRDIHRAQHGGADTLPDEDAVHHVAEVDHE